MSNESSTSKDQASGDDERADRNWLRDHRAELAPLYAATATLVIGAMAHQAENGLRWLLALVAATAVMLAIARWRRGDTPLWRYFVALWTAATMWLVVAAITGVQWPHLGVLLAGLIGFGVPWWRTFRHQVGSRPVAPAPASKTTPLAEVVQTWQDYVAADKSQALPGSRLTGVEWVDSKGGWSATIALPRGLATGDAAIAATPKIASAYELPVASVMVESPPDGAASHAKILVLPDNPLYRTVPFTRPSLDIATGLCEIGTYADGDLATWPFFQRGSGGVMGLVAGATGSGKSRLVEQLLAEARHSGIITSWIIDPQGGQSLPAWMDAVDWSVRSSKAGMDMLLAAKQVMLARSRSLARQVWTDEKGREHTGKAHFDPTPEIPLLFLVIEEAPQLFLEEPDAADLVGSLAKMGRKCGLSIVLACQNPTVAELGDNSTIRSQVKSGVVACLRTTESNSARMAFPGRLPGNPADIPARLPDDKTSAGLGYIGGAGTRTAMMRCFYLDDPYEWAETGTPAPLDALSMRAAGDAYAAAHQSAGPEHADDVDTASAVRHGSGTETDAAATDDGRNGAVLRLVDEPLRRVETPDAAEPLNDEPDWVEPVPLRVAQPSAEKAPDGVDEAQDSSHASVAVNRTMTVEPDLPEGLTAVEVVRHVVESAGGAVVTPLDIVETCRTLPRPEYRYRPRAVTAALKQLVEEGHVEKIKQGQYQASVHSVRGVR